jgi:hypothetical protein
MVHQAIGTTCRSCSTEWPVLTSLEAELIELYTNPEFDIKVK